MRSREIQPSAIQSQFSENPRCAVSIHLAQTWISISLSLVVKAYVFILILDFEIFFILGLLIEFIGAFIVWIFYCGLSFFKKNLKRPTLKEIVYGDDIKITNLYTNSFKNRFIGVIFVVLVVFLFSI